jgi:copper chaperone CopZ
VTFAVNMHCNNYKARIKWALTWHKGGGRGEGFGGEQEALTVRVRFDPRKTSVQDIQQAIAALGYTYELIRGNLYPGLMRYFQAREFFRF